MVIYYKGVRYDTLQGLPWLSTGSEQQAELDPKAAGQPSVTPEHFDTVTGLTVTQNGTYVAPSGTAYSPVSVNVDLALTDLALSVTANGEYHREGQFGRVDVSVDVPQLETEELVITRLGEWTAPAGRAYSKVTVSGRAGTDAILTTNGAKEGLYDDPVVAVPASRESVPSVTFDDNGEYACPSDKVWEKVIVDVPKPVITYVTARRQLEFSNVDLDVI